MTQHAAPPSGPADAPSPKPRIRSRFDWMDAVRGGALLLLLLWHASSIPSLFGAEMPEWIRLANSFFRPYRMPVLMFLSGMLLARSLSKTLSTYYTRKIATLVWPWLIWMLIARVVFVDTERMMWWHWRSWYGTTYLWFLFFLTVYYLVAPLLQRFPRWTPVAIAFVLGVVLPHGSVDQRLAYFAVFFFAGHCLSSPLGLKLLASRVRPRACVIIGVLLGIASMVWTESLAYNTWTAPLSLCGIWAVLHYSSHGHTRGSVPRLRFLGRSSIVYYVSHFPIMMVISRALPVVPFEIVLLINLVAALAVGTGLVILKHRVGIRWLFTCPDVVTRRMAERMSALAVGRSSR